MSLLQLQIYTTLVFTCQLQRVDYNSSFDFVKANKTAMHDMTSPNVGLQNRTNKKPTKNIPIKARRYMWGERRIWTCSLEQEGSHRPVISGKLIYKPH